MQAPAKEKVNILLVDDQPGKLTSYEVMLSDLDENLIKAASAKEALEVLLKTEVAVILVDICMPELDGFELAQMIREHPRFKDTAIIFISAVLLSELDSLKAYEMGGVDHVTVPVVPALLRAKVRVFVELYRKSAELERINGELELRVKERTSALEAAIAQQELLAREVDHRARNALTVIQSIVAMMPSTPGVATARVIEGRIRAMARAHTLLSQARWEGADLARLIDEELEPYRGMDRIIIHGPRIAIKPDVAQNFALAVHELATNAAKYGALSVPMGRLDVSWTLTPKHLVFHWTESNGPPAVAPSKLGFGSKVIKASIAHQLGGTVDKQWLAEGLRATLTVPSENFSSPAAPISAPPEAADERVGSSSARLQGRRILLVEDEPLVGMMMSQICREYGAEIVGPFGTISEALGAVREEVDVAILDVNVAGEQVYPVAERLAGKGTPFIFLTGYDSKSIDARFSRSLVLTKPIDSADLARCLSEIFACQTEGAN